MTNVFGNIFTAPQLEAAFQAHLETWLPTYIAEIERQQDIPAHSIALPKFYGTSVEPEMHPGEAFPAVLVVSPGTAEAPMGEGDGKWAAWYQLTVVVLVMSSDEIAVRALAGYYSGAVRGAVLQHGSIDGIADGVRWEGEEFQGEPGEQRNRTRGAALVHFRVRIAETIDTNGGLRTPPTDPYNDPADLPIVQTIEITAENE